MIYDVNIYIALLKIMLFLKYILINAKKGMFYFIFVAQVYFCCPGIIFVAQVWLRTDVW